MKRRLEAASRDADRVEELLAEIDTLGTGVDPRKIRSALGLTGKQWAEARGELRRRGVVREVDTPANRSVLVSLVTRGASGTVTVVSLALDEERFRRDMAPRVADLAPEFGSVRRIIAGILGIAPARELIHSDALTALTAVAFARLDHEAIESRGAQALTGVTEKLAGVGDAHARHEVTPRPRARCGAGLNVAGAEGAPEGGHTLRDQISHSPRTSERRTSVGARIVNPCARPAGLDRSVELTRRGLQVISIELDTDWSVGIAHGVEGYSGLWLDLVRLTDVRALDVLGEDFECGDVGGRHGGGSFLSCLRAICRLRAAVPRGRPTAHPPLAAIVVSLARRGADGSVVGRYAGSVDGTEFRDTRYLVGDVRRVTGEEQEGY
ncbi:unnamed protein product [Wuchereria bancrofti]|uniref:Uncharacterized protein n=1 Tax=Wuchereria bancrofti TaxID=6293 RepID=A0A3P7FMJ1_WUCBA|nr:unnamed protein product [Wuchereria bancrofti]